jgi:hypothetical protein
MKVAPGPLLAILAILGACGCKTASTNSIAHTRPPQFRPQPTFDLDEFVAEHNENSERIRSLEARPAISVKIGPPGQRQEGAVDGRLALERPRNFKLELYHIRSTVADIGSNDKKFWFWFQNRKDKSVYYCDYAELDSTSLAITYQPDWIVEAMGLKAITAEEAAGIKVRPGPQPGTTVLSFPPSRSGGQTYSRVMLVSDLTRKVQELRVIAADGRTLIAQATIKKYRAFPVARPGSNVSQAASAAGESCSLPEDVLLEWKREMLALDVVLKEVKLNSPLGPDRRAALFVEPAPSGYARVNLAEVARQKPSEGSTAVRETMPAPEARSRARLGPPLQIRQEETSVKTSRRQDPAGSRSLLLLPVLDLDVIGAPVPTAPDSQSERTSSALLTAPPTVSLER